jgi:uncharacterized membrane protein
MARHPAWVRRVLTSDDLDAITRAIGLAESHSAAEIRVHLDARCPGEPLARAQAVFESLGMQRTAARAGVLVYLSLEDHRLAVLGDRGVHARVGQAYWDRLASAVAADLAAGRVCDGLLAAVRDLDTVLAAHFPRGPADVNELGDDVSLGPA